MVMIVIGLLAKILFSEVLNNAASSNTNGTGTGTQQSMRQKSSSPTTALSISTSTSTSQLPLQKLPSQPPPRSKMNAYPLNHSTEIRNYAELYSVTKFNWNYLTLKSRSELSLEQNRQELRRRRHRSRQQQQEEQQIPILGNESDDSDSSSSTNAATDTAISTISISFSPDGRTVASTHGDHTVKITCCNTGTLIRNLEGHPRTPWTVKYHPTKPNLVASGCLGFQVRVWDWNYRSSVDTSTTTTNNNNDSSANNINKDNEEKNEYDYHLGKGVLIAMYRFTKSIISLSFHPTGSVLGVSSGEFLYLWAYDENENAERRRRQQQEQEERLRISNDNSNDININSSSNGSSSSSLLTAANAQEAMPMWGVQSHSHTQQQPQPQQNRRSNGNTIVSMIKYESILRCVHFPPNGKTIILGGNNRGETCYELRLWDFDLDVALNPNQYVGQQRAISNTRTVLTEALLYNDGGFDISPDGKTLCGCARIVLKEGFNSYMEMIEHEEEKKWTEEMKKLAMEREAAASAARSNSSTVKSPKRKSKRTHQEEDNGTIINSETNTVFDSNGNQAAEALSPTDRQSTGYVGGCRTPPNHIRPQVPTSPPSPPVRRWSLSFKRNTRIPIPLGSSQNQSSMQHNASNGPPPPPLPPSYHPNHRAGIPMGLSNNNRGMSEGRSVPHAVVVNLDTEGSLGEIIEATPLGSRAASVTCVKFSPSAEFFLLGYGVREQASTPHEQQFHTVTETYRIRGGLTHVATMLSSDDDDVNIARFHPHSGHGFVYGTKQGRVRVLSPRPWNLYYE